MNGGHDLGGRQGLGLINPEPESEEPVFHNDWEKKVFALTIAAGMLGKWNIDESRHARERQHPADYLRNSYYENWLEGTETLLLENGLVKKEELDQGTSASPVDVDADIASLQIPNEDDAVKILFSGASSERESSVAARFKIGDVLRVKKIHTTGHTRAPNYIQGVCGEVVAHYGAHIFPDKSAGGSLEAEHLYCLQFSSESLWGSCSEKSTVRVDLWEPYLEKEAD